MLSGDFCGALYVHTIWHLFNDKAIVKTPNVAIRKHQQQKLTCNTGSSVGGLRCVLLWGLWGSV